MSLFSQDDIHAFISKNDVFNLELNLYSGKQIFQRWLIVFNASALRHLGKKSMLWERILQIIYSLLKMSHWSHRNIDMRFMFIFRFKISQHNFINIESTCSNKTIIIRCLIHALNIFLKICSLYIYAYRPS